MTGIIKKFIDVVDFYQLNTSYVNVRGIWLNPMEFMATHDGTTLGLQTISLQGVDLEEVVFANLDLIASFGKYTVDPTTNSIILIVDPAVITSEALAKDYIQGLLLNYNISTIEYYSTDALYTLETYTANGTLVNSTSASSMGTLVSKMYVLDADLDLNSETSYYSHTLRRALQVAV